MALLLSPAKLVLLAVHCAVNGDIGTLTALAARHPAVLRKDLLLRILLTYLPETLPSSRYIGLIQHLEACEFPDTSNHDVDCNPVEALAEDDAAKRVRKLRLLPLASIESLDEPTDDPVTLFLLRRSYRVDEEAGLLDELPDLLLPFLNHSPCIRALLVSVILPLLRRNCEYYPQEPISYTLSGFQQLPDRVAANLLLSQTGAREADLPLIGRDLKGLIGPWLAGGKRWKQRHDAADSSGEQPDLCPGWDAVLCWLTAKASKNWKVAVNAIQQFDGPRDADLAGWGTAETIAQHQDYLLESYMRAVLASAYLIPEASLEALDGAYSIIAKVAGLWGLEPLAPLPAALTNLPPLADQVLDNIKAARNVVYMRNDLLAPSNPMTEPTEESVAFLQASVLSAHILTQAGCPCTIRRAGELALLQDEREQKAEAAKLIHAISNNGPKTDDRFWLKARTDILWLRNWGPEDSWNSTGPPFGVFSQVKTEFLEVEILRALLSNTRYALARSIYEDVSDQPLDPKILQETIYATAMTAYDNASNPNRTRGGLKKCDDILKAFPKTIQRSDPQAKRIEALLQATHSLSTHRLVLKQGEPFTPVVLRVHSDPISIIGKILEQNPKSYTHLHDLLALGSCMVEAGLTVHTKNKGPLSPEEEAALLTTAERRITAMCIDAALAEDDFETAYSYVVNRLPATSTSPSPNTSKPITDDYSWKAALQAGKYRLAHPASHQPHTTPRGGMASANPAVRHLEQRIECLATALRIAPPSTLQEIVNAFRRAEEELDVLIREEDAREDEWDARGDAMVNPLSMPGSFRPPQQRSTPAAPKPKRPADDEAPVSLFDLSRASVRSAQRNLSALSGLQRSAAAGLGRLATSRHAPKASDTSVSSPRDRGRDVGRGSMDLPPLSATESNFSAGSGATEEEGRNNRVRKRDQLREAAMGTLVSGVGWLVGAPAPAQQQGQGGQGQHGWE
ncbi:protein transport protein sec39 [Staphylotrichum tortipilum]|uniref:Protein transport protein sec39 n=1 Tax=Staphylotrichum tortipilum TaxID=2831512 RepID=A0AAN6MJ45_9PEZI|nr:protein transport protein sec39 [Staphylotrichum longicolle]